ncbi:hypothetical protein TNIN_145861 [Trichonephila inaurata madagascariensis]|uniref:Uncharacterized protein n=1 Tax=Trichonephila inaurata madagascariensis TaxID=2747483 RepID=A0A8X6YAA3_9ARAC|nr:hypothetical protein TNIN_145861 [Trichonephila inaurata madagascariensis]
MNQFSSLGYPMSSSLNSFQNYIAKKGGKAMTTRSRPRGLGKAVDNVSSDVIDTWIQSQRTHKKTQQLTALEKKNFKVSSTYHFEEMH